MMRFVVDHLFKNITLDRFVEVYYSENFNNAIAHEIGLKQRSLVDMKTLADGKIERRVRIVPEVPIPVAIRAIMPQQEIRYDEVSVYNPQTYSATYTIDSAVNERVKVTGLVTFRAETNGVRRRIETEIDVRVFGLGGAIEKLVETETGKSYAKIATFMQRYLDQLPTSRG